MLFPKAEFREVRDYYLPVITNDNMMNYTMPVCYNTNLPLYFIRYRRDVSGKFRGYQLCRGYATPVNVLKPPELISL